MQAENQCSMLLSLCYIHGCVTPICMSATPARLHCQSALHLFTSWFSFNPTSQANIVHRLCHSLMQVISHMDFSSNGRQLAVGFENGSVAVVACLPWRGGQTRWDMVGHLRPHPTPTALAGLAFGEAPSGVTKLFSLGIMPFLLLIKALYAPFCKDKVSPIVDPKTSCDTLYVSSRNQACHLWIISLPPLIHAAYMWQSCCNAESGTHCVPKCSHA